MSQELPKLFSYYRSSCSYRVRIALNLKKVKYDYVPIHLINDGGDQNSSDYLKINPMAQIPFYYDGEMGLSQSMAIIQYLDQKYPDICPLFPEKINERNKVIELCEIVNSGIQPVQNLSVMQKLGKDFGLNKDQQHKWSKHWIEKGLAAYEQMISKISGKYSLQNTLTAADLFLVPQAYNARRFDVDITQFPQIEKIVGTCLSQEAFLQADPQSQPDTPE